MDESELKAVIAFFCRCLEICMNNSKKRNAITLMHLFVMFFFSFFPLSHMHFKDRDKLQKIHLAEAVEGLKRYNARRKLKGAVQALAGAVLLDCTDSDSKALF